MGSSHTARPSTRSDPSPPPTGPVNHTRTVRATVVGPAPETKSFPTESKRRPLIREKSAPSAYRINDPADAIEAGPPNLYALIGSGKIPRQEVRQSDVHSSCRPRCVHLGRRGHRSLFKPPEPEPRDAHFTRRVALALGLPGIACGVEDEFSN